MIRTIIADDHKMFVDGIRSILAKNPEIEVVGEAADGDELLHLLQKNPAVDLVLLDIEMDPDYKKGETERAPKKNGIELTKIIRRDYPRVRILILTYHSEGDYIYNLHKLGADGYVIKNKGGEHLLGAIRDIFIYKNRPFPGLELWDNSTPVWKEEEIQLTSRELEVLKLAGLTSKEIADELGIEQTTVDTHLKNMRGKFKVDNMVQLVRKAIKMGIIKA